MSRSLGFAAYRALSRRRSRSPYSVAGARPEGEVLWLHASTASRVLPLCELGCRVRAQRDDLAVLVTTEADLPLPPTVVGNVVETGAHIDRSLSDHPADAQRFLDHWRPDICLWAGASLMPNLVSQSAERGIAMVLIDVDERDFSSRRRKWFPDPTRYSLRDFETIMTNSEAATGLLRRSGVPADRIATTQPLRNGPSPAPFPEDDLSATARQLAGRPLWLAAHARPDEFEMILSAHRAALKLIHRLLLVLPLEDAEARERLEERLRDSSLRHVHWEVGDEIDDNTQVLVTRGQEDLGLWYRMAPLTLMASSLTGNQRGRSPMEAVALGSAILFGPHVKDHRESYSRLAAVGAARGVGDAQGLGNAVIRLVAPDHAAAMALAGWEVVTEGAELTDLLVELVLDRLDTGGASHARP